MVILRLRLSIGSAEPVKKHFFWCFPDLFKDQWFYFYGNKNFNVTRWVQDPKPGGYTFSDLCCSRMGRCFYPKRLP